MALFNRKYDEKTQHISFKCTKHSFHKDLTDAWKAAQYGSLLQDVKFEVCG